MAEPKLTKAPAVREIGERLIDSDFPDLSRCVIEYVFTNQKRSARRRPVISSVQRMSPLLRYFADGDDPEKYEGPDLVMVISQVLWEALEEEGRRVEIDQRLCEIDVDEKGLYSLKAPDLMVSIGVIKRHGLDWSPTAKLVAEQLSLWQGESDPRPIRGKSRRATKADPVEVTPALSEDEPISTYEAPGFAESEASALAI